MTARERRTVFIGVGLVAAAFASRMAVFGVRQARVALEEARAEATVTTRARALVAQGPARQADMRERSKAIVELAPALLAGPTGAEAAATLAGELNAFAARHRLAITRLDPIADTGQGVLTAVQVRLQAESDLAGIYGFIRELEGVPLLLSLDDLTVASQDPDARMERLRLEATIRGWVLNRTAGSQGTMSREDGR